MFNVRNFCKHALLKENFVGFKPAASVYVWVRFYKNFK